MNHEDDVTVPETMCLLPSLDIQELRQTIIPSNSSENYGVDLYMSTFAFFQRKLNEHLN